MKITGLIAITVFFYSLPAISQSSNQQTDTTINNLVLPEGYVSNEPEAIPYYIKVGKGKQAMILIPGLGFDAAVFSDFMEANKNDYTMYAITIPGYGKTKAPPMPAKGTSYGEQSWNKQAVLGIAKLIEKEKLQKPIIAGHFTQGGTLALRMAVDYPDKIGSVIVAGACAKFIAVNGESFRDFPLDTMIYFVDRYSAPVWFKSVSKKYFDDNNYLPEIYSLDSTRGAELWKQSADVPIPVMIRYLCEFFASDIKTELHKIKCPVLILRSLFSDKVLKAPVNSYIKRQFIDSWDNVPAINPLIQMKDIPGSASFIWKDKPMETYAAIKDFLDKQK